MSTVCKMCIRDSQCDDQVQTDQKIESEEDLKNYMEHLELKGEGGTDFRPAFAYVENLMKQHAFERLKGLLYFTDGRGTYPSKMPPYETAFVFMLSLIHIFSLVLGLAIAGRLEAIGIGTVIAMVGVGRFIALFNYFWKERLDRLAGLLPQEAQMEGPVDMEGTLD